MWKFSVGDAVVRPADVFKRDSPLMHGVVLVAYSNHHSDFGPYPELYGVLWDGKTFIMGYLPHGIRKEES